MCNVYVLKRPLFYVFQQTFVRCSITNYEPERCRERRLFCPPRAINVVSFLPFFEVFARPKHPKNHKIEKIHEINFVK